MTFAVYTTSGRSSARRTPPAATSCTCAESPAGRPIPASRKPRWAPKRPSLGNITRTPPLSIQRLRQQGHEIAAIETSVHATDLYDWQPRFPVCVLFGHEVDGLADPLLALCDTYVRIPMLGRKHSLNVATAGGVVIYELLRKYRLMLDSARIKP